MKIIKGDILSIEEGIICHQVNCMGVMGAGLAKKMRVQFPGLFEHYKEECYKYKNNPNKLLGRVLYYKPKNIKSNLLIANIFGQLDYGYNKVYTDLEALKLAITELAIFKNFHQIYLPYGIGCGLGGANWEDVAKIIDDILPEAIVVKYD